MFLLFSLKIPYISDHPSFSEGGINKHNRAIPLRQESDVDSPAVASLAPHAYAPIEVKAVRWTYISYNNETLAVPNINFEEGYVRIHTWVIKRDQWELVSHTIKDMQTAIIVLSITLFFIAFLLWEKTLSNTAPFIKKVVVVPENEALLKIHTLEQEQQRMKKMYEKALLGHREQAQTIKLASEKQKIEFEQARQKALTLGIDLNDAELDNLIKGRLFEEYAAKYWNKHKKITILDWTPDKGFNNNIYVASNGNPDFLLQIKAQAQTVHIAIECKYRTKPFTLEGVSSKPNTFFTFEAEEKIQRYDRYSKNNDHSVYILLGTGGTASSPKNIYLVPVSEILANGVEDRYKNLSLNVTQLKPFKVDPDDFYLLFSRESLTNKRWA